MHKLLFFFFKLHNLVWTTHRTSLPLLLTMASPQNSAKQLEVHPSPVMLLPSSHCWVFFRLFCYPCSWVFQICCKAQINRGEKRKCLPHLLKIVVDDSITTTIKSAVGAPVIYHGVAIVTLLSCKVDDAITTALWWAYRDFLANFSKKNFFF